VCVHAWWVLWYLSLNSTINSETCYIEGGCYGINVTVPGNNYKISLIAPKLIIISLIS